MTFEVRVSLSTFYLHALLYQVQCMHLPTRTQLLGEILIFQFLSNRILCRKYIISKGRLILPDSLAPQHG